MDVGSCEFSNFEDLTAVKEDGQYSHSKRMPKISKKSALTTYSSLLNVPGMVSALKEMSENISYAMAINRTEMKCRPPRSTKSKIPMFANSQQATASFRQANELQQHVNKRDVSVEKDELWKKNVLAIAREIHNRSSPSFCSDDSDTFFRPLKEGPDDLQMSDLNSMLTNCNLESNGAVLNPMGFENSFDSQDEVESGNVVLSEPEVILAETCQCITDLESATVTNSIDQPHLDGAAANLPEDSFLYNFPAPTVEHFVRHEENLKEQPVSKTIAESEIFDSNVASAVFNEIISNSFGLESSFDSGALLEDEAESDVSIISELAAIPEIAEYANGLENVTFTETADVSNEDEDLTAKCLEDLSLNKCLVPEADESIRHQEGPDENTDATLISEEARRIVRYERVPKTTEESPLTTCRSLLAVPGMVSALREVPENIRHVSGANKGNMKSRPATVDISRISPVKDGLPASPLQRANKLPEYMEKKFVIISHEGLKMRIRRSESGK